MHEVSKAVGFFRHFEQLLSANIKDANKWRLLVPTHRLKASQFPYSQLTHAELCVQFRTSVIATSSKHFLTRIGTVGWSFASADANLLGEGDSVLARFAKRINAVEITSSFHRPHQQRTYFRWAASVLDFTLTAACRNHLSGHQL